MKICLSCFLSAKLAGASVNWKILIKRWSAFHLWVLQYTFLSFGCSWSQDGWEPWAPTAHESDTQSWNAYLPRPRPSVTKELAKASPRTPPWPTPLPGFLPQGALVRKPALQVPWRSHIGYDLWMGCLLCPGFRKKNHLPTKMQNPFVEGELSKVTER